MLSVSKGTLKAKMFDYFRRVEKTHEKLIVTDHNKPVLVVMPYSDKKTPAEVFGKYRGKVTYSEDINTPTSSEWGDNL